MEGLSLLLNEKKMEGRLSGVKVSRTIKILHVLFVDDVVILSKASAEEWMEIDMLLKTLCSASRLMINITKSTVLQAGLSEEDLRPFKALFPFKFEDLEAGFKYLGFYLKTSLYRAGDWCWLLKKMEKKISNWCFRWLSLGGRYILLKAVLESESVYWMSLALIPGSVLNSIRKLMYHFLWKKNQEFWYYPSMQMGKVGIA
jgi:hypothetical protein